MSREGAAVAQEIEEAREGESLDRLEGMIVALEADQLRLARANEERAARDRQRDLRYLEFVREVLR
jgi:hypothetical protein